MISMHTNQQAVTVYQAYEDYTTVVELHISESPACNRRELPVSRSIALNYKSQESQSA